MPCWRTGTAARYCVLLRSTVSVPSPEHCPSGGGCCSTGVSVCCTGMNVCCWTGASACWTCSVCCAEAIDVSTFGVCWRVCLRITVSLGLAHLWVIDKLTNHVLWMIYLSVDPLVCRPGFFVVGLKRSCVSFFLLGGTLVWFENGVVVVDVCVALSLINMLSNWALRCGTNGSDSSGSVLTIAVRSLSLDKQESILVSVKLTINYY